jgi:transposase
MTEIHQIRQFYFENGNSITRISQQTGKDRKTIRQYLDKADWNQVPIPANLPADFPKLAPYKDLIEGWLTEDKRAKRKQRHTAKRVYDRLKEKYPVDFKCSYRTVAAYVAQIKPQIYGQPAGYLPLEHVPGEAQADFGDCQFYEGEQLYNGKYLNLSFPYSNQGYLQLFKGENQQCLLEGLQAIFEHLKGVPPKIWWDNTKTIVSKVMQDNKRTLTADFLRFQEHYRFTSVFCNLDAGHEKGHVENKVGYHRRNLLVPVPHLDRLTDYNHELLSRCDQDGQREHYRKEATIAALFANDQAALLPLPAIPLDVSQYLTVKTNGYGRFYLQSGLHEYSVSPQYAHSQILVKVTAHEVIPLGKDSQSVVKHPRLYGESKQQSMQWLPYLTQLSRRPRALKYSGLYQMLPPPLQEYLSHCNGSETGKVLRVIAGLTEQNGFEKALETVKQALQYEATDIDSLLSLHHRIYDKGLEMEPLSLAAHIPQLQHLNLNLAAYDAGLARAGADRC